MLSVPAKVRFAVYLVVIAVLLLGPKLRQPVLDVLATPGDTFCTGGVHQLRVTGTEPYLEVDMEYLGTALGAHVFTYVSAWEEGGKIRIRSDYYIKRGECNE